MNPISQLNHEGEFERVWADPSNTGFELPPVDASSAPAAALDTWQSRSPSG
jgi:hypothetical protein